MRSGVPSPDAMQGKRFWVEAEFRLDESVTVPVSAGNLVWSGDAWPATRVQGLLVPRVADGRDLLADGLIGSDGHRVVLTAWLDTTSWPLGEYLVERVKPEGAGLLVDAVDLTQLVVDHHGRVPEGVHRANTINSVVRRLLGEDRIDVVVDPALANPEVPRGFSIATERGKALQELLTAWSAQVLPGFPYGVRVVPVSETLGVPLVTVSEGVAGTIVDAPLELNRDSIFNHVVACVKDSEKVAEAVTRDGRYAVDRFGWRTKRIESDAISSFAQAQTVALTELAKARIRPVTVPVECFPDWRVEPYEPVRLITGDLERVGRVTGFDFPLTHEGTAVLHIGVEV